MTNDKISSKNTSSHIADEADKASDTIKKETAQLADEAKDTTRKHAEKQFEKGQDAVASQVDTLSSAVDEAASALKEEDHPLGHYTREIADSMSGLSEKISNSSIDELAHDTRKLARENPGLFMLGSIAIGVAASRFFKASAERDSREYMGSGSDHNERHASDYGRSTSIRRPSPYAGTDRHSPSMQAHQRETERFTGSSGAVDTAASPNTSTAQERPRVNPPVTPAGKSTSTSTQSVEESEGA